jgi:hypothetical protein
MAFCRHMGSDEHEKGGNGAVQLTACRFPFSNPCWSPSSVAQSSAGQTGKGGSPRSQFSSYHWSSFPGRVMLERYLGFGGMRIEENVLVTPQGCRILGKWRPRTIEEVEHVRAQHG